MQRYRVRRALSTLVLLLCTVSYVAAISFRCTDSENCPPAIQSQEQLQSE